jgi:hypothetical protein
MIPMNEKATSAPLTSRCRTSVWIALFIFVSLFYLRFYSLMVALHKRLVKKLMLAVIFVWLFTITSDTVTESSFAPCWCVVPYRV